MIKNTIVISQVETLIKRKVIAATKNIPTAGEIQRSSHTVVKTKQRPVEKLNNTKEIEKTLLAWSAAWSAQAVDIYLSFYHNQYKPTNGLSRKGWIQSRHFRLKKPRWIKIGLSNFVFKQNNGKQAVVNFKQLYQSNSFRDVSEKQMVLLHTDEGWRIFREKSI